MVEGNRWLIYALGGGWGHLNRAIALARQAPHPVEILVNSPYATAVETVLEDPHITLRMLPADLSAATAPTYVQAWISQPANCLIVDTFPRGLVGELADILPKLQLPRILIHRDLNPNYIAAKNITAFVRQHYDQILIPGEPSAPLAHLPQAHGTDPWLLREADELSRVRDQVRDCWQLPSDRPVIIICATGRPDEAQRFGEL
ncbi:MAG: hypothetical protein O2890_12785, partial [Cyanobacteria bacterium]|nr:hypothetical protein [Cyanobacteriota bacterium]